jgi:hypothetical protein
VASVKSVSCVGVDLVLPKASRLHETFTYNLSVKPITAVRIFWTASIALFIAAIVGLRWGPQISIALLPAPQRAYADRELLHGMWISRSIFLFLMCAVCGLLGIYFSVRASDRQQR